MAERRMFSKTIIDSDVFLDMPLSTQALYFHLAMRADDEGFVNNPKKVQRMVGASEDDLKLLIMKRYILTFESGIIVIKHWKIHNYIQNDRFKPTTYVEERSTLTLDGKRAYTECIQDVSKMEPQVSIELGKDSIDKRSINTSSEQVAKKGKFEKPTVEEVDAYCKERNNGIDAEAFIAFYESKGWLIGKTPMKSWKSAIITWEKSRKTSQTQPIKKYGNGDAYDYQD
jgi:hypothetical protein